MEERRHREKFKSKEKKLTLQKINNPDYQSISLVSLEESIHLIMKGLQGEKILF